MLTTIRLRWGGTHCFVQVFLVFEPGQVADTVCLRHVAVVYVADPVMEEARRQQLISHLCILTYNLTDPLGPLGMAGQRHTIRLRRWLQILLRGAT